VTLDFLEAHWEARQVSGPLGSTPSTTERRERSIAQPGRLAQTKPGFARRESRVEGGESG
jgi:hypothetical protein